jgi:hypothetical protein
MLQAGDDATENAEPPHSLSDDESLAWLCSQPGGRTTLTNTDLARLWGPGWYKVKVGRRLDEWSAAGLIRRDDDGAIVAVTDTDVTARVTDDLTGSVTGSVTNAVTAPVTRKSRTAVVPIKPAPIERRRAVLQAVLQPDVTASAQSAAARVTLPPPVVDVRPRESAWYRFGRCIVGLVLILAALAIAFTSMRANAWFGYALSVDNRAGELFSTLSVAAEVIALFRSPTGSTASRANGGARRKGGSWRWSPPRSCSSPRPASS